MRVLSVLQNANESTLISHSHSPLIQHSVSSFDMLSMAPLIRYLPHSRIWYSCFPFTFFYPFLSGLHWHFINFYCISRIWSIQFSHKVREVSAFSRFSLSLPWPLSHTLSFSNALRDAFPDGQCWKLITLQLDFCPVTRWKWLQLVAGTEVVLQLFCSVLPLYVRQFSVCPLPQPMRPQLTQLFNWIEAINTQSETEIEIGDGVAWKMSAREEQAKTHPVASLVGAK